MPQQIYKEDRDALIDPLSGVDLNQAYFDDPSRYYSINFNPTQTSSITGKSIYKPVFDDFEKLYKDVTGSQIDLSKGSRLAKGFDRKLDSEEKTQRRMKFEQRVIEESDKSVQYGIRLGQSQKDNHVNFFAGEAQGLVEYLESYLPPIKTVEGGKMRAEFYGTPDKAGLLDRVMDNFVSPMIKQGADITGEYHNIDTAGEYGKRALGSFEKTAGAGLMANKDLFGRIAQFVGPAFQTISPEAIAKTSEQYSIDIFEKGKFIRDQGAVRYEEAAPARGIYSQTVPDRGLKAFANLSYMAYKGTESIGSQILTTGLGVTASTIAQLHPAVRGAGMAARYAIGLAASSPAIAAGYVLESGDYYNSAIEELKKIRQEANDIKISDKKAWESDVSTVGYKIPYFNDMTADLLSDKQIEDYAAAMARQYGAASSFVEIAGTSLGAGVATRAASKQLGIVLGSKEAQRSIAKNTVRGAATRLKAAGKGFAGNVFAESLTEGIQEFIQESMLASSIPKYEANMDQIFDAAYAGGVFGGGMSVTGSTAAAFKDIKDIRESMQTEEQKNEKSAKEIKKGKVVKDFDESIIGASLLGLSLDQIVEQLSANDGTPAAIAMANELRGRYSVLQDRIDEISNDPARAAGFFKKYKADLELTGFVINEKSLGNLVLQPEQIADILGVNVEDLGSDEVIPKKESPRYRPPTSQSVTDQNLIDLEDEFGNVPNQDLSSIDQYDPTIDPTIDPTLGLIQPNYVEDMINQADKSRMAAIDLEIQRLGDLSQQNHLSPLDREIAIKDLKAEKEKISQESTTTVTTEGKQTNYKALKVSEMKDIASARGLEIKEPEGSPRAGKDLLRADLISLLEESDQEKAPKTMAEAGLNHAKRIIGESGSGVTTQAMPTEILETFDDDLLINHANNIVVDSTPFMQDNKLIDRQGLMDAIIKQQGPTDFNMGVPLFFKQKNKSALHQTFRQGYFELLKKVPDLGSSEGLFRKWVEQHVGPNLPEHLQAIFYDWANTFAPNETLAGDIAYAIYDKLHTGANFSQAFQSDMKDIDNVFLQNVDWMKEAVGQQDTEGSDIHTENFTHLNSGLFEAMDVVLKKDKIDEITDLAKNAKSFEDFVTAMSSDEIGLRSADGLTAADLVAGDSPLKRKLKQFFVSNLVENNVIINDGDLGMGQFKDTPGGRKTVQASINRQNSGWQNVQYTINVNADKTRKNRKPGYARATMADRFLKTPLVWLNGVNVTKSDRPITNDDGSRYFGKSPIYGFLTGEDIKELASTKLYEKGLVPLFIKGDADRIGTIKITERQRGLDPDAYWRNEVKESTSGDMQALGHQYLGLELTDDEMIAAYGSVAEYKAAGIARHEAYKELLGDNYHSLTAHKIMQRIKILFTPATTRTGGDISTLKLINLEDPLNNDGQLVTRTTYKNGDVTKKNLIIFANGKNQYAGDGMTITSERVFSKKYFDEVGANPLAKRAKTVKVVREGNNTLLMKHQEMTFNLPENAKKSEIFNGTEKVAEIRRENGEINIYVQDDKGGYNRYIDHLATTDEAKVQLGDYTNFDKVHELPSEATGHIQFTEADKQKAPFPMQVTNYLNDPGFLKELNNLIEDPNNPGSAARVIDHMITISQNPDFFNEFLKSVKQKHPDSMPRMIIEMASMGAGLHPSQLDYGSVLVKNRLFSEAMDVKQEGGVLDFRPNLVSNIEKGKIVLPFGHSLQLVVARKLAELKRVNMDTDKIMRLSREDLNQLIKENPIKVMLVRHPVPSRAGYRMLNIDSFESGIGDSFMINDEDVKEVFEGDYDHDTGHISILPDVMTHQLVKNETFQNEMAALSLDKWADKVQDSSIGDFNSVMELMGEMTFGQTAIGEVANVQRIAGISQSRFGSMTIDGRVVKVRNLKSTVNDPALGEEMSLEQLFRHYAQAAFDNVSLRLLKQWDYSQEKLYKMLFYNEDGSAISDIQYQVLNTTVIPIMKKTQAIKNGRQFGKNLTLEELMNESAEYNEFVQDPNNYILSYISDTSKRRNKIEVEGKFYNAIEYIGDIKMKDGLHPHEKLAIMPIQKLNMAGLTSEEFFKLGTLESRNAHNESYKEVSTDQIQLGFIMDAVGAKTIQELQNQDPNAMLSQMQSGNEWGAYMRTAMNEVYKTIEKDDNTNNSRIANSMTWDYNVDFVDFVDDWLDGYTRTDGSYQKGYNELTEVEKVAATYTFLGGVHDAEAGFNKRNVRKIPPVSSRAGESLLHPGIMKEYFSKYNDIVADKNFDHERYGEMNMAENKFQKTIREYMGCE